MEVITTHINADFDAFASMVAAKKLYPEALVAFPGSQEKNLRDFFIESTLYILSIERAKHIALDDITRLILVDTRQKGRIGRFGKLAESENVEVIIYDHHPSSQDDLHGGFEVVREVGATVTLLIEEIRNRKIELNAEEATVLALGIYEDTGSFTFSSTTPFDLDAAGWLLRKGANLNIIANMMTSDLSAAQIELLHELIQESESINLHGIEVVITTAGAQNYVGDLAVLVHKYKDMENFGAIFAIVRLEDRVHLIGRSSIDEVNAGEIVSEFGGGGHSTAASATIRNMSLYEVREKLVSLLNEKVRPKQTAGEIMTKPVITVEAGQTVREAGEFLSRYQVSSLPVVGQGKIVGILHRNAVEKATHHGLDISPVSDYMNPGIVSVTPDDLIEKVLNISVEGRHRLVPVMEDGNMVGVISRSDLLEHLKLPRTSDASGPDDFRSVRSRNRNVRRLMDERLPSRILEILKKSGVVAESRMESLYLVGGAVRDLLLRNDNFDVDLVIEGDGIGFARELSNTLEGCRVRTHDKFRTAVLMFSDGLKIDVATARLEYYSSPGALPTVETSSLKRDLYRRDFTINTLAVSLNPPSFGIVTDFFGGHRDIKEKVIRVLHNLAFVEDPTRILRAVRFSSRFGFSIGKHTLSLMKSAMNMGIFDRVEGKRILNEIIHILFEKNPLRTLELVNSHGILYAIHPTLTLSPKSREILEASTGVLSWWKYLFSRDTLDGWLVYFLALTEQLSDEEFSSVTQRLSFPGSRILRLIDEKNSAKHVLSMFARGFIDRPSRIVESLAKFSFETLLFMMAKTAREQTRMSIAQYIQTLRHVKPVVTGDTLARMGYHPGPIYRSILNSLRDAKLDGMVKTVGDEIELVQNMFPLSRQ
jgi:tRNA nucleotidyltransferase (CCA-adding enzyme)